MEIKIKVFAESGSDRIIKEKNRLLVYAKAKKQGGMANASVLEILAKHFGVDKKQIKIKRGLKTQNKMVEIYPVRDWLCTILMY